MSDTFGKYFVVTTWGESHGKAIGVVIDGCPAGIELDEEHIQKELDKRKPGQSEVTTTRKEEDMAHIMSGVFKGKTTGTPVSIVIYNKDADSTKYEKIKELYRPGHADYTYEKKYGIRDYRGGGRSSGRETASRVAGGAVAKRLLEKHKIEIHAYAKQIANIRGQAVDYKEIYRNPVRAADKNKAKDMQKEIESAREEKDSVGGIVEVVVKNCPAGLGEPVFDKLDAEITKAIMSLGAVKGIEFGSGFNVSEMKGSENNDGIDKGGFSTNNSGGILGGISNGEDIVFRFAVKPTPSIAKKQNTTNSKGDETYIEIEGRHDPCIIPRIVPVAESMVAIVLADKLLSNKLSRCE